MKYAKLPPSKQIGDYQWNHQALLGEGSYGKVYLGRNIKSPDQFLAIKVMLQTDFKDPEMKKALGNELNILKTLKGVPNNMGLIDHLETRNSQYIIQQFCNGGDFRSVLSKKGSLPEPEAIKAFGEMLAGMNQLVARKIIHRDLKPENTLIQDGICHIADYGFSAFINNWDNEKLTFFVGTPLYMSPQIMENRPYTTKCDVWSLGIIYYEMLFGKTPFPCRSIEDLKNNTLHMPVTFPSNVKVSNESKDLIKQCLQVDESKRMSWQNLLHYPLFTQPNVKVSFHQQINLDKEGSELIHLLQKTIAQYKIDVNQLFAKFDKSGDHQLDEKEFFELLHCINKNLNPVTLRSIFKQFDVSNDGQISMEEFKRLAIETTYYQPGQEHQSAENVMLLEMRAKAVIKQLKTIIERDSIDLTILFNKFDSIGDTNLDINEFGNLLKTVDPSLTANEISYIFTSFDKDNSKSVSINEFKDRLGYTAQIIRHEMEEKSKMAKKQSMVQESIQSKLSNQGRVNINKLKMIIHDNNLDLKLVYKKFDKDNSGTLDIDEFGQMLQAYIKRLNAQENQEIFHAIKLNGSNNMNFNEFESFFAKPNIWSELAEKLPTGDSQQDEERRKRLFRLFDPNHNGYLSLAEIDKGIKDILCCEELFKCKQAIARAFHAAKNSGKKPKNQHAKDYVELDEFKNLLIYLRQYFEYNVMFQKIDSGHDRRIDLNEFTHAIPLLKQFGVDISDPKKEFSKIDRNGGGQILFDEFAFWAIQKKLDLPDDDDFKFDEKMLYGKQNFCDQNIK